jgi:DNA-binding MarR family transcriptional regulator
MADLGHEIQSSFSSEGQKAILNIKFTANFLNHLGNGYLRKFNISLPQYNILRILRGAKTAITVNSIKDRMVEKSPNTTRLMDKLMDKELVVRSRCKEDRRVVFVEITLKGLEVLNEINMDYFNEYTDRLSQDELIHLNMLLNKIRG